ncbi:MAG TPA: hypothetical protein VIP98_01685 [Microlunatus sp.]
MSRNRGALIKTTIAAAAAALVMPMLASAPAHAATATFPIVQDCSPFGDFYNSWTKLPTTLYADGTRWVPQGLAYDPGHGWLITSYYDGRDGVAAADRWPSMLVITTLNGHYLKRVMINTSNVDRGGHAGGLGVAKGNLYVASTEHGPRVTKINLQTIARTRDGATLPEATTVDVAAASFATVQDGDLYVGDFENNRMYRYPTDRHGDLITDAPDEYPTPTLVQGVAVSDHEFIFSRSYGRTRLSYLTTVDRSTGSEQSTVLPNMAEGITWAPGSPGARQHLYVLFESGSAAYGPDDDGGSTTCMTHQLWHRAASEL